MHPRTVRAVGTLLASLGVEAVRQLLDARGANIELPSDSESAKLIELLTNALERHV